MVISAGGGEADGAGASKVTRDVANTVAQLPELVEALTGIDLLGTLKHLPGVVTSDGAGAAQPAAGADTPTNPPEPMQPEDA